MENTFSDIALALPSVMLPKAGTDLKKWAVVACDQYTSQPQYWDRVRDLVGDSPSTLNLIFPEVYLEQADQNLTIENINAAMAKYLADGTLVEQQPGFVLVDRQTSHATSRKGLVVALDLEQYSYDRGSTTLIRATEGTVMDRLPPRIKIRQNAPIELPHIMVLIDDPGRTVIEPLFHEDLPVLYDTDLMMDGGHIKGYQVSEPRLVDQVTGALKALAEPKSFNQKYGLENQPVMLYAMGDGNHSFATAKAIWEKLKSEATDKTAIMEHPARYALVELVNVHDAGLNFEPIHRVLFGVDPTTILSKLEKFFAAQGVKVDQEFIADPKEALKYLTHSSEADHQVIPFVSATKSGVLKFEKPKLNLPVANLQLFIDSYLQEDAKVKVDYIHGQGVVTELGQKMGNFGFYLPVMAKSELFKTVILDGALPRKTFSMGEAEEKRYYFECRKITSE